jgi:hypothetical protein
VPVPGHQGLSPALMPLHALTEMLSTTLVRGTWVGLWALRSPMFIPTPPVPVHMCPTTRSLSVHESPPFTHSSCVFSHLVRRAGVLPHRWGIPARKRNPRTCIPTHTYFYLPPFQYRLVLRRENS